jgi:hypothetical protein
MNRDPLSESKKQSKPILLFNDECAVCRHIGHWVQRSAQSQSGDPSIIVQPIGDDPETLRSLNPALDIWDAYATIHVLVVFRRQPIRIPAISSCAQCGLCDPVGRAAAFRL